MDLVGSGLPQEGTIVVFADRDGKLAHAGMALDQTAQSLIHKAIDLEPSPLKHGRVIDVVVPSGASPDRVVVVVLGKDEPLSSLDLEEAGAGLMGRLKGMKAKEVTLTSTDGLEIGVDPQRAVAAIALGAGLRAYAFDKYRGKDDEDERAAPPRVRIGLEETPETNAMLERINGEVAAVARTRDLVSEPANVLYPESFAERCRELEAFGIEIEILTQDRLRALGMRALLGVAQGSVREPRVVIMRWNGAAPGDQPVALVGKGVCFDTGGISIKPAGGMEDMKWDMAGAGAVVGAMHALAARKARVNITGIIGLVENMPSGSAQRPGDVVKAMSGKTIEVINTDAEGRLVLADIVWYTAEHIKPRAIIDLATLTGAIIVALGHERGGLFASEDSLAEALLAAGEAVGEPLWRMPLGKAYEKHIRSEIADIKNVGRAREAGATAGAVFIQEFTQGLPWAHLDIAGVAWSSRDRTLTGKGATGFGVRLLDRLVADHFEGR